MGQGDIEFDEFVRGFLRRQRTKPIQLFDELTEPEAERYRNPLRLRHPRRQWPLWCCALIAVAAVAGFRVRTVGGHARKPQARVIQAGEESFRAPEVATRFAPVRSFPQVASPEPDEDGPASVPAAKYGADPVLALLAASAAESGDDEAAPVDAEDGETPSKAAVAKAAVETLPTGLPHAATQRGFARAHTAIRACRQGASDGVTVADVRLVVRPDGHVAEVGIEGPLAGTPAAACIAAALRDTRFDPFRGDSETVSYALALAD
jgi:hypothetical protein